MAWHGMANVAVRIEIQLQKNVEVYIMCKIVLCQKL